MTLSSKRARLAIVPMGLTRREALGSMLGSALLLMGCGGGGGSQVAGVTSGGTGSFTSGTIIGFGSIIVNGVRYDDTASSVGDIDGNDVTGTGALKLGMVVAVQGSVAPAAVAGFNYTSEGTAQKIVYLTELQGPVDDGSVSGSTFTVFGQPVTIDATTVVEGVMTTIDALDSTHFVEVYGLWDTVAQTWQASRVEVSSTAPTTYRLTGEVRRVDAATLEVGRTINGVDAFQLVDVSGLTLDPVIVDGVEVRVTASGSDFSDRDVVTNVRPALWSAVPGIQFSESELDGAEVELEGVIRNLDGSTFTLQGISVNAAAIAGNPLLAEGRRVEVKGYFNGLSLVAQSIEDDGEESRSSKGVELHGVLSNVTASTFVLRGLTIAYNAQTRGTTALSNGMGVEAKVARQADGSWLAIKVEADEGATSSSSRNDDDGSDREGDSDSDD